MLTALLKSGKQVTLARLSKEEIEQMRRQAFFCPVCKTEVIVRAGPKIIPHFAHRAIDHCISSRGEGPYHEKGKLLLYQWLLAQGFQVHLEYYLPSIKQRPDILLQIGKKKIAIEYQCVPLSTKEVMKRNQGYERLGIIPIWILGAKLYKRKRKDVIVIPPYQQSLMHQFSKINPTFLFYFCPQTKMFNIISNPYFYKSREAIVAQRYVALQGLSFLSLFDEVSLRKQQLYTLWRQEKYRFRLRANQTYGRERKWQYWLYEKGMTKQSLPSIVYLPIHSQWKMKVPLWHWQSVFVLEFLSPLPLHHTFTLAAAKKSIGRFQYDKVLFPLMQQEADPLAEYLQCLQEAGVIQLKKPDVFEKVNELAFYQGIEEAVAGDNELLSQFMYT